MATYVHNGVTYSNDWLPGCGNRVVYIKVGSLSQTAVNGIEGPFTGDICTVDRNNNMVDCQNWTSPGHGPFAHELYLNEKFRFWRFAHDLPHVVPPPGYGVQPTAAQPAGYHGPTRFNQAQQNGLKNQGATLAGSIAAINHAYHQIGRAGAQQAAQGIAYGKPAETRISVAVAQCVCKKCNTINEYAEPNMPDGTYICFSCR